MRFFIFSIFVFVFGCKDPDGCIPEETICEGSVLKICNTEKNWEESMDCSEASVGGLIFSCEEDPYTGDYDCMYKGGDVFDTAFETDFDAGEADGGR